MRKRLIKTGPQLVRHGRHAIFQIAEVAIPGGALAALLDLINTLEEPPSRATYA